MCQYSLDMATRRVVREAISGVGNGAARLSEEERRRLLETFDRLVPAIPGRPLGDVERELAELRRGRRAGGRVPGAAGRGKL